jgi:PRTRC genetic system protein E
MTMFEELFALATSVSLTLTISADPKAGRMTINVIPRPNKDADEPALTKALSLTATPQEFDDGFVAALQGYREVRQSLADQVEATKEVLEAAKLASVKKAADASTKAPADRASPATSPKPATDPTIGASDATGDDDADAAQDESRPPAKGVGEAMDLFG